MNHTHKRRSKTPPLSVLFNTIIAQNTIIAIIYFKLYVSEFLGILKYPLSPKRTLGSLIRKKTETKIFPLLQP